MNDPWGWLWAALVGAMIYIGFNYVQFLSTVEDIIHQYLPIAPH